MRAVRTDLVLIMVLAGHAFAADWPQWRGPAPNGTSPCATLPVAWSEQQNVKWKVPLPSWSGATPAVWQDRVYVTSPNPASPTASAPTEKGFGAKLRDEGRELRLLCLARADGKPMWSVTLDTQNAHYGKQNLSSPSPVVDAAGVYTMTGTGVLTALTHQGQLRWRRELPKDFGKLGHLWGYASSPLLLADKLIVEVLHGSNTDQPSYVLAFDLATGRTLWKVDRPTDAQLESPDAYTTPMPLRHEGHLLIVVSGGDYITAHDPADGREVWRCGGLNPEHNERYRSVSSPLTVDGLVIASVRDGPLVACRAGGAGLVSDTHIAWTQPIAPDVPTPVSDGKLVYVL